MCCPCLWALLLVLLPLISCRFSQDILLLLPRGWCSAHFMESLIFCIFLRMILWCWNFEDAVYWLAHVVLLKGTFSNAELIVGIFLSILSCEVMMSRRAEDTKAKSDNYFSGLFVKYWWLFYCVIRWRHARGKTDLNSREYFCLKDCIESFSYLIFFGLAECWKLQWKITANLSGWNHTAILGHGDFWQPESNWELVLNLVRA